MSVWKSPDRATYRYKFYVNGRLFQGNTGQITKADAEEWEYEKRRQIRRQFGGLAIAPEHSPSIQDWAETYYGHVRQVGRIRRLDRIEELIRVVLRFWGFKPKTPDGAAREGDPYHDLRLADPIMDPSWLLKFEDWMRVRGVSAQTRNHYRSIMSRMYRLAARPEFARQTGVTTNPFLTIERERTKRRRVTVTPAELRRWLHHTQKHAQLAIAIAALAPKLRLQNVLGLRWDVELDPALQFITVAEHKTVDLTGEPLVVPVSKPLRAILAAARRERRGPYVIQYRGHRVKSIRGSVRAGARAAGLTYGRDIGGVTFHTIRHTAATLLAEVPRLSEAQRAAVMGQDVETTQRYTHLRPVTQRPTLDSLGRVLKLEDVFARAFGETPEAIPETVIGEPGPNPTPILTAGHAHQPLKLRKTGR
jgi:integrase